MTESGDAEPGYPSERQEESSEHGSTGLSPRNAGSLARPSSRAYARLRGAKKGHIVQPRRCNQAWRQALIHHGSDTAPNRLRGGRHGSRADIKAAPQAQRARPAAINAAHEHAARVFGTPAQARGDHGHGHRAVHESIVAARPPPLNPGLHAVDATPARRRGGAVSHRSIQPARTAALSPRKLIFAQAS